jgi:hypothetical protein
MTMSDMGVATQVSDPGSAPVGGVPTSSAAPGAQGPAGNMPMATAVIATIVVPVAALATLRLVFGSKDKLPPLRVDATNALNIYFSWLVVQGALKIIAYRYHGHKLAQAFLLIA